MIDIHCHMLPGVDDGSDSMDTSLLMASMAAESGVETVIVTPHCNIPGEAANYPSRELLGRFMALREAIDTAKIPLHILAGAEVFCTADIAELIRAKKLLTLASSRYLLVEFAFNEDSIEMNSRLEQIFAEGLTPVIAHPERYNAVQRDRTLPERWFASGYVLQINKDSIFGGLGQRAKRTAEFILAGAEVFCTADIAELIRAKKLLTLASSRYLLVEFAFNEDSIEMNSRLEQIFAEGLTPVIAHPERYNAVQRDRTLPERWFASGYVLQINKDSIFGGLGQRAKRTAEFILGQGLAHIAASDAHSTYSRNPEMSRLREHISLNYSEDYAQVLLEENPRRIIENKPMLRK